MNSKLEQSILSTLAYFDQFSYPLTYAELYNFLWKPPKEIPTFLDFIKVVNNIELVEIHSGFVYLNRRKNIVQERQIRKKFSRQKLGIAEKGVKKITWIPYIKAVFVCNTLALGHAEKESDIDLLIVTRKHRIWTTRFFVTLVLSVLRLRRHGRHVTDRLCLSFYVTEDALDFSHILIDDPDIYFAYWIATLLPLYDPENVEKKIHRQNTWLNLLLPNLAPGYSSVVVQCKKNKILSQGLNTLHIGDLIERALKWVQRKRMMFTKGSVRDLPDTRVVISDTMLKFHENDRRVYFKQQWQHILAELGL